ncbi:MAG: DUF3048 domain-containing protein [Candidatus Dormibacteria bacterium]
MPAHHVNARILALIALLAGSAVACGTTAATKSPTPKPGVTPSPTAAPATPAPTPGPPPLSTPWVVQVENLNDARPQSGLSTADIVYEYETEGGISRFSALFLQPPTATVGPVRSARLATIRIVNVYDATLVYSGASTYVIATMIDSGVRQYDEGSSAGALYRISSRAAPHNLYTDGAHFAPLAQRVGSKPVSYQLWNRVSQLSEPPGGSPMPKFTVPVSDSETPTYSYDSATGGYQRTEPDTGVLTDADTQAPWEPKSILVLPVAVTLGPEIENPPDSYGLDFALVSGGQGQLLVGGQLFPVTFAQGGSGPPQLKLASGAPAPVAPGQVLIELVKTGRGIQPG